MLLYKKIENKISSKLNCLSKIRLKLFLVNMEFMKVSNLKFVQRGMYMCKQFYS